MITKTKFWQLIREGLKDNHLADKTAEEIMKRIKDISQNENKKKTP